MDHEFIKLVLVLLRKEKSIYTSIGLLNEKYVF